MAGQEARARSTPTFGREAGGRKLPPRKSRDRAPRERSSVAGALRRRDRRRRLHAAVRRLTRRQGHLARRDRGLHQRDRAVPQPVAVPAREVAARTTTTSRRASARRCARSSTIAKAGGPARARGRVGLLRRSTPRATTSSCGRTTTRTQEWLRFTFPRQRKAPFLCIADFFRPRRVGRAPTTPRSTWSPMGDARERAREGAVRRRPVPGLPAAARPLGRDDRGARRAVAPPHPRGVGLRRRGRPDARRPVPPAVPRLALLVGLPRVPRPRRPGEARRAARDRPHRRDAHRGVPPRARAVARRRSSSPTPRPSTSSSEADHVSACASRSCRWRRRDRGARRGPAGRRGP